MSDRLHELIRKVLNKKAFSHRLLRLNICLLPQLSPPGGFAECSFMAHWLNFSNLAAKSMFYAVYGKCRKEVKK